MRRQRRRPLPGGAASARTTCPTLLRSRQQQMWSTIGKSRTSPTLHHGRTPLSSYEVLLGSAPYLSVYS
eukprot:2569240-Rhodomonas_salina.2